MLFASLKRILNLTQLRLRGPNGAGTSLSLPPSPETSENSPDCDHGYLEERQSHE